MPAKAPQRRKSIQWRWFGKRVEIQRESAEENWIRFGNRSADGYCRTMARFEVVQEAVMTNAARADCASEAKKLAGFVRSLVGGGETDWCGHGGAFFERVLCEHLEALGWRERRSAGWLARSRQQIVQCACVERTERRRRLFVEESRPGFCEKEMGTEFRPKRWRSGNDEGIPAAERYGTRKREQKRRRKDIFDHSAKIQ